MQSHIFHLIKDLLLGTTILNFYLKKSSSYNVQEENVNYCLLY